MHPWPFYLGGLPSPPRNLGNWPKELINILNDKWNIILWPILSCFELSTCSIIQVGSMLSSQRLNKVMAEVGKTNNNNNNTEGNTRTLLPVFFLSTSSPVLFVTQWYSSECGVLDPLPTGVALRDIKRIRTRLADAKRVKHAMCARRGKTHRNQVTTASWLVDKTSCLLWLVDYVARVIATRV